MTTGGTEFIKDDNLKMISLDDMVQEFVNKIPEIKEKCSDCVKTKCKLNFQYSSTDALYVLFPNDSIELYFIEFKKKDIRDPTTLTPYIDNFLVNFSNQVKKIAEDLVLINKINWHLGTEINVDYTIKMLKDAKDEARKSEKNSLKLKPLESLYCVLQWIYQLYCFENSIIPNSNAFESFLLGCKKEYIIVYEEAEANRSKAHLKELRMHHSCENNPFDCHRLSPHPFDNIKTRNQLQFLSFINCITNPETCGNASSSS